MNKAITATNRYRWPLLTDGADEDTHATRARAALAAIVDDVQAMTTVIPFPAGLRFMGSDEDRPTVLSRASLAQQPATAITAADPWGLAPYGF